MAELQGAGVQGPEDPEGTFYLQVSKNQKPYRGPLSPGMPGDQYSRASSRSYSERRPYNVAYRTASKGRSRQDVQYGVSFVYITLFFLLLIAYTAVLLWANTLVLNTFYGISYVNTEGDISIRGDLSVSNFVADYDAVFGSVQYVASTNTLSGLDGNQDLTFAAQSGNSIVSRTDIVVSEGHKITVVENGQDLEIGNTGKMFESPSDLTMSSGESISFEGATGVQVGTVDSGSIIVQTSGDNAQISIAANEIQLGDFSVVGSTFSSNDTDIVIDGGDTLSLLADGAVYLNDLAINFEHSSGRRLQQDVPENVDIWTPDGMDLVIAVDAGYTDSSDGSAVVDSIVLDSEIFVRRELSGEAVITSGGLPLSVESEGDGTLSASSVDIASSGDVSIFAGNVITSELTVVDVFSVTGYTLDVTGDLTINTNDVCTISAAKGVVVDGMLTVGAMDVTATGIDSSDLTIDVVETSLSIAADGVSISSDGSAVAVEFEEFVMTVSSGDGKVSMNAAGAFEAAGMDLEDVEINSSAGSVSASAETVTISAEREVTVGGAGGVSLTGSDDLTVSSSSSTASFDSTSSVTVNVAEDVSVAAPKIQLASTTDEVDISVSGTVEVSAAGGGSVDVQSSAGVSFAAGAVNPAASASTVEFAGEAGATVAFQDRLDLGLTSGDSMVRVASDGISLTTLGDVSITSADDVSISGTTTSVETTDGIALDVSDRFSATAAEDVALAGDAGVLINSGDGELAVSADTFSANIHGSVSLDADQSDLQIISSNADVTVEAESGSTEVIATSNDIAISAVAVHVGTGSLNDDTTFSADGDIAVSATTASFTAMQGGAVISAGSGISMTADAGVVSLMAGDELEAVAQGTSAFHLGADESARLIAPTTLSLNGAIVSSSAAATSLSGDVVTVDVTDDTSLLSDDGAVSVSIDGDLNAAVGGALSVSADVGDVSIESDGSTTFAAASAFSVSGADAVDMVADSTTGDHFSASMVAVGDVEVDSEGHINVESTSGSVTISSETGAVAFTAEVGDASVSAGQGLDVSAGAVFTASAQQNAALSADRGVLGFSAETDATLNSRFDATVSAGEGIFSVEAEAISVVSNSFVDIEAASQGLSVAADLGAALNAASSFSLNAGDSFSVSTGADLSIAVESSAQFSSSDEDIAFHADDGSVVVTAETVEIETSGPTSISSKVVTVDAGAISLDAAPGEIDVHAAYTGVLSAGDVAAAAESGVVIQAGVAVLVPQQGEVLVDADGKLTVHADSEVRGVAVDDVSVTTRDGDVRVNADASLLLSAQQSVGISGQSGVSTVADTVLLDVGAVSPSAGASGIISLSAENSVSVEGATGAAFVSQDGVSLNADSMDFQSGDDVDFVATSGNVVVDAESAEVAFAADGKFSAEAGASAQVSSTGSMVFDVEGASLSSSAGSINVDATGSADSTAASITLVSDYSFIGDDVVEDENLMAARARLGNLEVASTTGNVALTADDGINIAAEDAVTVTANEISFDATLDSGSVRFAAGSAIAVDAQSGVSIAAGGADGSVTAGSVSVAAAADASVSADADVTVESQTGDVTATAVTVGLASVDSLTVLADSGDYSASFTESLTVEGTTHVDIRALSGNIDDDTVYSARVKLGTGNGLDMTTLRDDQTITFVSSDGLALSAADGSIEGTAGTDVNISADSDLSVVSTEDAEYVSVSGDVTLDGASGLLFIGANGARVGADLSESMTAVEGDIAVGAGTRVELNGDDVSVTSSGAVDGTGVSFAATAVDANVAIAAAGAASFDAVEGVFTAEGDEGVSVEAGNAIIVASGCDSSDSGALAGDVNVCAVDAVSAVAVKSMSIVAEDNITVAVDGTASQTASVGSINVDADSNVEFAVSGSAAYIGVSAGSVSVAAGSDAVEVAEGRVGISADTNMVVEASTFDATVNDDDAAISAANDVVASATGDVTVNARSGVSVAANGGSLTVEASTQNVEVTASDDFEVEASSTDIAVNAPLLEVQTAAADSYQHLTDNAINIKRETEVSEAAGTVVLEAADRVSIQSGDAVVVSSSDELIVSSDGSQTIDATTVAVEAGSAAHVLTEGDDGLALAADGNVNVLADNGEVDIYSDRNFEMDLIDSLTAQSDAAVRMHASAGRVSIVNTNGGVVIDGDADGVFEVSDPGAGVVSISASSDVRAESGMSVAATAGSTVTADAVTGNMNIVSDETHMTATTGTFTAGGSASIVAHDTLTAVAGGSAPLSPLAAAQMIANDEFAIDAASNVDVRASNGEVLVSASGDLTLHSSDVLGVTADFDALFDAATDVSLDAASTFSATADGDVEIAADSGVSFRSVVGTGSVDGNDGATSFEASDAVVVSATNNAVLSSSQDVAFTSNSNSATFVANGDVLVQSGAERIRMESSGSSSVFGADGVHVNALGGDATLKATASSVQAHADNSFQVVAGDDAHATGVAGTASLIADNDVHVMALDDLQLAATTSVSVSAAELDVSFDASQDTVFSVANDATMSAEGSDGVTIEALAVTLDAGSTLSMSHDVTFQASQTMQLTATGTTDATKINLVAENTLIATSVTGNIEMETHDGDTLVDSDGDVVVTTGSGALFTAGQAASTSDPSDGSVGIEAAADVNVYADGALTGTAVADVAVTSSDTLQVIAEGSGIGLFANVAAVDVADGTFAIGASDTATIAATDVTIASTNADFTGSSTVDVNVDNTVTVNADGVMISSDGPVNVVSSAGGISLSTDGQAVTPEAGDVAAYSSAEIAVAADDYIALTAANTAQLVADAMDVTVSADESVTMSSDVLISVLAADTATLTSTKLVQVESDSYSVNADDINVVSTRSFGEVDVEASNTGTVTGASSVLLQTTGRIATQADMLVNIDADSMLAESSADYIMQSAETATLSATTSVHIMAGDTVTAASPAAGGVTLQAFNGVSLTTVGNDRDSTLSVTDALDVTAADAVRMSVSGGSYTLASTTGSIDVDAADEVSVSASVGDISITAQTDATFLADSSSTATVVAGDMTNYDSPAAGGLLFGADSQIDIVADVDVSVIAQSGGIDAEVGDMSVSSLGSLGVNVVDGSITLGANGNVEFDADSGDVDIAMSSSVVFNTNTDGITISADGENTKTGTTEPCAATENVSSENLQCVRVEAMNAAGAEATFQAGGQLTMTALNSYTFFSNVSNTIDASGLIDINVGDDFHVTTEASGGSIRLDSATDTTLSAALIEMALGGSDGEVGLSMEFDSPATTLSFPTSMGTSGLSVAADDGISVTGSSVTAQGENVIITADSATSPDDTVVNLQTDDVLLAVTGESNGVSVVSAEFTSSTKAALNIESSESIDLKATNSMVRVRALTTTGTGLNVRSDGSLSLTSNAAVEIDSHTGITMTSAEDLTVSSEEGQILLQAGNEYGAQRYVVIGGRLELNDAYYSDDGAPGKMTQCNTGEVRWASDGIYLCVDGTSTTEKWKVLPVSSLLNVGVDTYQTQLRFDDLTADDLTEDDLQDLINAIAEALGISPDNIVITGTSSSARRHLLQSSYVIISFYIVPDFNTAVTTVAQIQAGMTVLVEEANNPETSSGSVLLNFRTSTVGAKKPSSLGAPTDIGGTDTTLVSSTNALPQMSVSDNSLSVLSTELPSAVTVTISDREDASSALTLTATFDATYVSAATLTGTSGTRTLQIVPTGTAGTTTVTLKLTDTEGAKATSTVTVLIYDEESNTPPTILSAAGDRTMAEGSTTGWLAVELSDVEDEPATLNFYATYKMLHTIDPDFGAPASDDLHLTIEYGGSGADRTIRVTPDENAHGIAIVTMYAVDSAGGYGTDTFKLSITSEVDYAEISALDDRVEKEDVRSGRIPLTLTNVDGLLHHLYMTRTSSDDEVVLDEDILVDGDYVYAVPDCVATFDDLPMSAAMPEGYSYYVTCPYDCVNSASDGGDVDPIFDSTDSICDSFVGLRQFYRQAGLHFYQYDVTLAVSGDTNYMEVTPSSDSDADYAFGYNLQDGDIIDLDGDVGTTGDHGIVLSVSRGIDGMIVLHNPGMSAPGTYNGFYYMKSEQRSARVTKWTDETDTVMFWLDTFRDVLYPSEIDASALWDVQIDPTDNLPLLTGSVSSTTYFEEGDTIYFFDLLGDGVATNDANSAEVTVSGFQELHIRSGDYILVGDEVRKVLSVSSSSGVLVVDQQFIESNTDAVYYYTTFYRGIEEVKDGLMTVDYPLPAFVNTTVMATFSAQRFAFTTEDEPVPAECSTLTTELDELNPPVVELTCETLDTDSDVTELTVMGQYKRITSDSLGLSYVVRCPMYCKNSTHWMGEGELKHTVYSGTELISIIPSYTVAPGIGLRLGVSGSSIASVSVTSNVLNITTNVPHGYEADMALTIVNSEVVVSTSGGGSDDITDDFTGVHTILEADERWFTFSLTTADGFVSATNWGNIFYKDAIGVGDIVMIGDLDKRTVTKINSQEGILEVTPAFDTSDSDTLAQAVDAMFMYVDLKDLEFDDGVSRTVTPGYYVHLDDQGTRQVDTSVGSKVTLTEGLPGVISDAVEYAVSSVPIVGGYCEEDGSCYSFETGTSVCLAGLYAGVYEEDAVTEAARTFVMTVTVSSVEDSEPMVANVTSEDTLIPLPPTGDDLRGFELTTGLGYHNWEREDMLRSVGRFAQEANLDGVMFTVSCPDDCVLDAGLVTGDNDAGFDLSTPICQAALDVFGAGGGFHLTYLPEMDGDEKVGQLYTLTEVFTGDITSDVRDTHRAVAGDGSERYTRVIPVINQDGETLIRFNLDDTGVATDTFIYDVRKKADGLHDATPTDQEICEDSVDCVELDGQCVIQLDWVDLYFYDTDGSEELYEFVFDFETQQYTLYDFDAEDIYESCEDVGDCSVDPSDISILANYHLNMTQYGIRPPDNFPTPAKETFEVCLQSKTEEQECTGCSQDCQYQYEEVCYTIAVKPSADTPYTDFSATAYPGEADWTVDVTLRDNDGSESISRIEVANIPRGSEFNVTTVVAEDEACGQAPVHIASCGDTPTDHPNYSGSHGAQLYFFCPYAASDCDDTVFPAYGNFYYASTSSVCVAAQHAGLLDEEAIIRITLHDSTINTGITDLELDGAAANGVTTQTGGGGGGGTLYAFTVDSISWYDIVTVDSTAFPVAGNMSVTFVEDIPDYWTVGTDIMWFSPVGTDSGSVEGSHTLLSVDRGTRTVEIADPVGGAIDLDELGRAIIADSDAMLRCMTVQVENEALIDGSFPTHGYYQFAIEADSTESSPNACVQTATDYLLGDGVQDPLANAPLLTIGGTDDTADNVTFATGLTSADVHFGNIYVRASDDDEVLVDILIEGIPDGALLKADGVELTLTDGAATIDRFTYAEECDTGEAVLFPDDCFVFLDIDFYMDQLPTDYVYVNVTARSIEATACPIDTSGASPVFDVENCAEGAVAERVQQMRFEIQYQNIVPTLVNDSPYSINEDNDTCILIGEYSAGSSYEDTFQSDTLVATPTCTDCTAFSGATVELREDDNLYLCPVLNIHVHSATDTITINLADDGLDEFGNNANNGALNDDFVITVEVVAVADVPDTEFPDYTVDEDVAFFFPTTLTASVVDTDSSESLSEIVLTGVQGSLAFGTYDAGEDSYSFTDGNIDDLLGGALSILSVEHCDVDFTIAMVATSEEASNLDTEDSTEITSGITILAVADAPSITTTSASYTVVEDEETPTLADWGVEVQLVDTDSSEWLCAIEITSDLSDTVIEADDAVYDITDITDGIRLEVIDQTIGIASAKSLDDVTITHGEHNALNPTITVKAISCELEEASQVQTETAETEVDLTLVVEAKADGTTVDVANVTGQEDDWTDFVLDPTLIDQDSSEWVIYVEVRNVDDGASVRLSRPNAEVGNVASSIYYLNQQTVEYLPPEHCDVDPELCFVMVTQDSDAEIDTLYAQENPACPEFLLQAVADEPTIDSQPAGVETVLEDECLQLDFLGSLVDTDGSEVLLSVLQLDSSHADTDSDMNFDKLSLYTGIGCTGAEEAVSTTYTDAWVLSQTTVYLKAVDDNDWDARLVFRVNATEQETGDQVAEPWAENTFSFKVEYVAVADAPTITGTDAFTIDEDETLDIDFTIDLTDTDTSEEIIMLTVDSVPANARLEDNDLTANGGAGEVDITALVVDDMMLYPGIHMDNDYTLTFVATSEESGDDEIDTLNADSLDHLVSIDVCAVADEPSLTIADGFTTDEDTAFTFDLTAATVDTDGTESITKVEITSENWPASVSTLTLVAGSGTVDDTIPANGFTLIPDDPTGTLSFEPALQFTPTDDLDNDFTVTVVVYTQEANPNGDVCTLEADYSTTIPVSVLAVADTPDVSGDSLDTPPVVNEGQCVALTLGGNLNDDSRETLTFQLFADDASNLDVEDMRLFVGGSCLSGSIGSAGTEIYSVGGVWDLEESEATGMYLLMPVDNDCNPVLTWQATATEEAEDPDVTTKTATASSTFEVTVKSVIDTPFVSIYDTTGVEDEYIPVDCTLELVDTDGSEVLNVMHITGVPGRAVLSVPSVQPDVGNLQWGANLTDFGITPPPDNHDDITLCVRTRAHECASDNTDLDDEWTEGSTEQYSDFSCAVITVTPAVDLPLVSANDVTTDEDVSVNLEVAPQLQDLDERLDSLQVSGLPDGSTLVLSDGAYVLTQLNATVYSIVKADGSSLDHNVTIPQLSFTPPENDDTDWTLTATSFAVEDDNTLVGIDEVKASDPIEFTVLVRCVADMPVLTGASFDGEAGQEDTQINLDISAETTDPTRENLSYRIDYVSGSHPDNLQFRVDGIVRTKTDDYYWEFTATDLEGEITVQDTLLHSNSEDGDGILRLRVTAYSTEEETIPAQIAIPQNEVSAEFDVDINPANDSPVGVNVEPADPLNEFVGGTYTLLDPVVYTCFDENAVDLTVIGGLLETGDPDTTREGDSFTFRFVENDSELTNDGHFRIDNDNDLLLTGPTPVNYEDGVLEFDVDIKVIDSGGLEATTTITLCVNNVNEPPTDLIGVSALVVDETEDGDMVVVENSLDELIGTVSVEDPDGGVDGYIFSFPDGTYDAANDRWQLFDGVINLSGNQLLTATTTDYDDYITANPGTLFPYYTNYEKLVPLPPLYDPDTSAVTDTTLITERGYSYNITVRATDELDASVYLEKWFIIVVRDSNDAPFMTFGADVSSFTYEGTSTSQVSLYFTIFDEDTAYFNWDHSDILFSVEELSDTNDILKGSTDNVTRPLLDYESNLSGTDLCVIDYLPYPEDTASWTDEYEPINGVMTIKMNVNTCGTAFLRLYTRDTGITTQQQQLEGVVKAPQWYTFDIDVTMESCT
eukprot:Rmarinus@m.22853